MGVEDGQGDALLSPFHHRMPPLMAATARASTSVLSHLPVPVRDDAGVWTLTHACLPRRLLCNVARFHPPLEVRTAGVQQVPVAQRVHGRHRRNGAGFPGNGVGGEEARLVGVAGDAVGACGFYLLERVHAGIAGRAFVCAVRHLHGRSRSGLSLVQCPC